MPYLLALDQGTTSSRSIIFGSDGRLLASAQQEFTQHYPKAGFVEHNADEIWQSQLATARQAINRAGLQASDIIGIGITNQRETTVIWDRMTGKPVHRAIVWQDRRTAYLCATLKSSGHEPTIRSRTGLVLDPYFSATKIRWLLDHVDGLRSRAEQGDVCFGTIDTWLMYNLSGGQSHVTDVSNASRTLLFNIHTMQWDDDLLHLFEVPRAMLPEVVPSAGTLASTDPGLFGESISISGVAGDQQAALFGQACFESGMAKNTYGTGSFVVMNTGQKSVTGDGVLTTIGWQIADQPPDYALEASIFITGAAVQWLRDGLKLIRTSAEIEDLAASVADNGGVYFVPALTGLGAPHWDPNARGVIIGLTRGTTAAHLARATIEAMAYQTRDGIEAMQSASGIELKELRVDGGATVNDALLQFQADMLRTTVIRPAITEITALGAAYLAAVGAGALSIEDVSRQWQVDRIFEQSMDETRRATLYRNWQRAVERAGHWTTDE